jgi:aminoglycoside 6'-N-acetyltransferase
VLALRPALESDVPALVAMLQEPANRAWWGENDTASVAEDLPGSFIVEIDGALAGWLQAHEETEPDYRNVAFDIALATEHQDRGHGREALRQAIDHFVARGHHRFTIDPAASNERAIRCYAAVGFAPVGILRAYERDPAGGWRDGLLMDLVVGV